jgi:hypothetical protein
MASRVASPAAGAQSRAVASPARRLAKGGAGAVIPGLHAEAYDTMTRTDILRLTSLSSCAG